jgi:hypothetical protein
VAEFEKIIKRKLPIYLIQNHPPPCIMQSPLTSMGIREPLIWVKVEVESLTDTKISATRTKIELVDSGITKSTLT